MLNDLRPDWDSTFMTLAFLVAQRSLDKHTRHGCLAVSELNEILSTGYNSPPRGCIDEEVPLERPMKYLYMVHSEANCINSAARCGISLENSTFYITGPPCNVCFRSIRNVGAKKIIYGPILHQRTEDEIKSIEFMNKKRGPNFSGVTEQHIEMREFKDIQKVHDLLKQTGTYIDKKLEIGVW